MYYFWSPSNVVTNPYFKLARCKSPVIQVVCNWERINGNSNYLACFVSWPNNWLLWCRQTVDACDRCTRLPLAQLNIKNRMHIAYVFSVRNVFSEAGSRRHRVSEPPAPSPRALPAKISQLFQPRVTFFFLNKFSIAQRCGVPLTIPRDAATRDNLWCVQTNYILNVLNVLPLITRVTVFQK